MWRVEFFKIGKHDFMFIREMRVPILTLDPTTYQSLWSRHMLQKVIDQRNHAGDMPYFSEDELYDFQLDVNTYYTKNMQRYLSKF